MSISEKAIKITEVLAEKGIIILLDIQQINHKPHQFTIGSEHIQNTTKPCAGYVDNEGNYSNRSKPGYHKCGLPIEQHTYDEVLFLQLTRNVTNKEAHGEMLKLKPLMESMKIEGLCFVDTDEQYRISEAVVKKAPVKKAVKKAASKKSTKK